MKPYAGGGVDDAFLRLSPPGIGAEVMGAEKFGPPGWHEDPEWKGWWGPNPPFHTPSFVTHHPHPPIEMEGGTTFTISYDGATMARHVGLLPRTDSKADRALLAAFDLRTRAARLLRRS